MVQLQIIFLGTSSSVPTSERGLTSVAIQRGAELLLFDVGEGTQRSMVEAGTGFNRRTKVLITHMHGDHAVGLLGLIQTMSMHNRERDLYIYGPKGIKGFLGSSIRYLKFGLTFPLHIGNVKEGVVAKESEYTVKAALASHSILTYSYLLEESPRPGVFHEERAAALGVPKGALWSQLQHGESVKIGGRVVTPQEVLGPSRLGRKIGISGDTRPSAGLAKFFRRADVLIFDSTYSDKHRDKAVENMHSTAKEAATIAKEAEVKQLILTHFSARYDDVQPLVDEAAEIHPNVIAAKDLMRVDVPYPS